MLRAASLLPGSTNSAHICTLSQHTRVLVFSDVLLLSPCSVLGAHPVISMPAAAGAAEHWVHRPGGSHRANGGGAERR